MANTNIPNLPETDLKKEDWKMIWGELLSNVGAG